MIQPRKEVIEMKPYSPPLEGRKGKIRLDFNENTVGCSPKVIKALRSITADSLSQYPEYSRLRNKLAAYCSVSYDEVIPTNATDEAIKLIFDTFLDGEIVLPTPTFAMFEFYAELAGAKIKKV